MGWGPVDWVGWVLPEAKLEKECTLFLNFLIWTTTTGIRGNLRGPRRPKKYKKAQSLKEEMEKKKEKKETKKARVRSVPIGSDNEANEIYIWFF